MDDLIEKVEDLGFPEVVVDAVPAMVEQGFGNPSFMKFCAGLTNELTILTTGEPFELPVSDQRSFSSKWLQFLKNNHCPHISAENDLLNLSRRMCAVDFMLSELEAARIIASESPKTDKQSFEADLFNIDKVIPENCEPVSEMVKLLSGSLGQVCSESGDGSRALRRVKTNIQTIARQHPSMCASPLFRRDIFEYFRPQVDSPQERKRSRSESDEYNMLAILEDIHNALATDYAVRRSVGC